MGKIRADIEKHRQEHEERVLGILKQAVENLNKEDKEEKARYDNFERNRVQRLENHLNIARSASKNGEYWQVEGTPEKDDHKGQAILAKLNGGWNPFYSVEEYERRYGNNKVFAIRRITKQQKVEEAEREFNEKHGMTLQRIQQDMQANKNAREALKIKYGKEINEEEKKLEAERTKAVEENMANCHNIQKMHDVRSKELEKTRVDRNSQLVVTLADNVKRVQDEYKARVVELEGELKAFAASMAERKEHRQQQKQKAKENFENETVMLAMSMNKGVEHVHKLDAESEKKIGPVRVEVDDLSEDIGKLRAKIESLQNTVQRATEARDFAAKDIFLGLENELAPAQKAQAKGLQRISAVMKHTAVSYLPFKSEVEGLESAFTHLRPFVEEEVDKMDESEKAIDDADSGDEKPSLHCCTTTSSLLLHHHVVEDEIVLEVYQLLQEMVSESKCENNGLALLQKMGASEFQKLTMPPVDPASTPTMDMETQPPEKKRRLC